MTSLKKVLVLGASGQLGQSLMQSLAPAYQPIGFSHDQLDICDGAKVQAALEQHRPSVLFNAAAWTDVDGCEKNVEKAYTVNAIAAGDIAEAVSKAGARMVHVSTDYVFDGMKKSPYTESDDPNPLSIYGKSKLEGERLVLKADPQALVVRSSWLFGMGRSNFVMRLFESVMVKTEIPVVTDRRGSPTFTDDLAKAMIQLLERKATGVVHVSNQGECSWYEYAQEIVKILKIDTCKIVPTRADQFKRPAPRPEYSVLDNGRYRDLVGTSLRPWQEALAEFLRSLNTDLSPSDIF